MSVTNNELTCLALTGCVPLNARRRSASCVVEGVQSDATQLNSTSSWVELCRYKRGLMRWLSTSAINKLTTAPVRHCDLLLLTMHTLGPFFQTPELPVLHVRLVPRSKLLGVVEAELLQVGCPSCHPNNSIKTLKVLINTDSVSVKLV